MADQFKLKAFVRIDGTGKVIPGGPIFQAHKPKVGKWREINVKECCNYNPNTTTTTSTSSSTSTSTSTTTTTTTVAPFSGDVYISGNSAAEACNNYQNSGSNATVTGNSSFCNSTTFASSFWINVSNGTYYIATNIPGTGTIVIQVNSNGSIATVTGACSSC